MPEAVGGRRLNAVQQVGSVRSTTAAWSELALSARACSERGVPVHGALVRALRGVPSVHLA